MGSKGKKGLLTISFLAAALLPVLPLSAQQQGEPADSLLRLISAKYIEQLETRDDYVRRTLAPTFLHNGTYLICDSAVWHQNANVINCTGHVRLIQGDTELDSETLDYLVDSDLAQFRGSVVELRDKQNNMLRTRFLDYNTKDSVAVFTGGASMKGADGQVIESDKGYYFNSSNLFSFVGRVDMYTDSVFVKTDSLHYHSDTDKADFVSPIYFWKDDNMLRAGGGWYDRPADLFFFDRQVRALSKDQESWSDTLYFHRLSNDILMLGSVQIQDTTRSTAAVADYVFYKDSLSQVTLRDNAAVAMWSDNGQQVDTTYFGADTLIYRTVPKCDVDSLGIASASERLKAITGDPVREFRLRAAQNKTKSSSEQNGPQTQRRAAKTGNLPESLPDRGAAAPSDSLSAVPADSLSAVQASDSLALAMLPPPPPDSTRIGFAEAFGNVKIFRADMQVKCDSMRFTELDSIARFYKDPIIWNEGKRQYSADSLFVLVKGGGVDRANLISNAFIAVEEDSVHFDQIKSSEVMAYFDSDTQLRRFDALGGVSAIFYLQEDSTLATVNKVETKMLSATLKDGNLEQVYYFDNPKNDAYPIVQLPAADRTLKGLLWRPELRPRGKDDITDLVIRPSGRKVLEASERTSFPQTDRFFPGYMSALRDSLEAARLRKTSARDASAQAAAPDSLASSDSLAVVADSLAPVLPDSIAAGKSLELLQESRDSAYVAAPQEEEFMSKAELRRALRRARRDARWAERDERDRLKVEEKERRKAEKEALKLKREAERRAKEKAEDDKIRQKYIDYYTKKKLKDERKQKSVSAGERAPGAEAGGSL